MHIEETTNPELFTRSELPDPDLMLSRVGIFGLDSSRSRGYMKYSPKDYLVQEVCSDGSVCDFRNGRPVPDDHQGDRSHLHCNLVKANHSTSQAIDVLCKAHGIPRRSVSSVMQTGKTGVTSQRVSFEGLDWDAIKKKTTNVRLDPVAYKSEPVESGQVKGNRFTILVRGDGKDAYERLAYLIGMLKSTGFRNFVSPEAFGSRLEAHKIGCFLARGDVDGALRTLFTEEGLMDLRFYKQMRQRLAITYGNWSVMHEILEPYAASFPREMRVLNRLMASPDKTRNALKSVQNVLGSYVQAYADWVYNRALSQRTEDLEAIVAGDGVVDANAALEPFGLSLELDFDTPRIVRPDMHKALKIPEGTLFSFTLPTHAYPDVFLSNLYRLYEKQPVPGWVKGGDVEMKMPDGLGRAGLA